MLQYYMSNGLVDCLISIPKFIHTTRIRNNLRQSIRSYHEVRMIDINDGYLKALTCSKVADEDGASQ